MTGEDLESLTLEQIDGVVWPPPPSDATRLMKTVHALRRKMIRALSVEDLRTLLGQREGVGVLVPRTLDLLEQDPLAEGDYYPGDLLVATLQISEDYWTVNSSSAVRLRSVVQRLEQRDDLDDYFPQDDGISARINELRSAHLL
ncbi:contact-dependent growth inhibition system immunity protein [Nocardia sp. NPDC051787]|uniref:contact-dependent growth inhibition system immunity protein n=1 Tax=Nocardia sp. NPDC051787 TaxID=3155415 RepID=UPI00341EA370